VIPGTTNQSRLEENLKANSITLPIESIQKIRNLVNSIEVHGNRYDENSLKKCNI